MRGNAFLDMGSWILPYIHLIIEKHISPFSSSDQLFLFKRCFRQGQNNLQALICLFQVSRCVLSLLQTNLYLESTYHLSHIPFQSIFLKTFQLFLHLHFFRRVTFQTSLKCHQPRGFISHRISFNIFAKSWHKQAKLIFRVCKHFAYQYQLPCDSWCIQQAQNFPLL